MRRCGQPEIVGSPDQMKPIRIIVLAVAAVAAIGLAVLVRNLISGKPTTQASAATPVKVKPMARVLVAKRDLKIGERIVAEDLDWQEWPVEAVNASFTTDGSVPIPAAKTAAAAKPGDKPGDKPADKAAPAKPGAKSPTPPAKLDKLADSSGGKGAMATVTRTVAMLNTEGGPKGRFVGAVVRETILKGEPLLEAKVVRAGDGGYLAVVLPSGMRAMAVPVKVENAAGGFILPGDHVDVILSKGVQGQRNGGGTVHLSSTILRNIKVLAIDQVTTPEKNENTVVGATATLEVTAEDAEALALARAEGDLSLTLRSYADVDQPSGRTAQAQHSPASLADGARTVRVFRNGQVSESPATP
jgi:pilus assembly protein CpaB